jgi:hypothetical protein
MMTASSILSAAAEAGLTISTDGQSIICRPKALVTNQLRSALHAHKAAVIAELNRIQLERLDLDGLAVDATTVEPPCPSSIAERSALIAAGDHVSGEIADARALAEFGFDSWTALVRAHRLAVTRQLLAMAPNLVAGGQQIVSRLPALICSTAFLQAVQIGYSVEELFGVHPDKPLERFDCQGLIIGQALSIFPDHRIMGVTRTGARIVSGSGSVLHWRRFTAAAQAAVPFWQCPALTAQRKDAA